MYQVCDIGVSDNDQNCACGPPHKLWQFFKIDDKIEIILLLHQVYQ